MVCYDAATTAREKLAVWYKLAFAGVLVESLVTFVAGACAWCALVRFVNGTLIQQARASECHLYPNGLGQCVPPEMQALNG